jgi:hypothetical protein
MQRRRRDRGAKLHPASRTAPAQTVTNPLLGSEGGELHGGCEDSELRVGLEARCGVNDVNFDPCEHRLARLLNEPCSGDLGWLGDGQPV